MYKRGTCWEGYVQAGMKKKGNKMVPNCVPAGSRKMKEGGLTKWFQEKWVDIWIVTGKHNLPNKSLFCTLENT